MRGENLRIQTGKFILQDEKFVQNRESLFLHSIFALLPSNWIDYFYNAALVYFLGITDGNYPISTLNRREFPLLPSRSSS